MPRSIRPPFSALNYYSNISLMFSAGLLVLLFVLLFIAFDEVRDRLIKFVRVFDTLLGVRKSLTPKVKVRQVDELVRREICHVFDL
jgi:hypothetical protein